MILNKIEILMQTLQLFFLSNNGIVCSIMYVSPILFSIIVIKNAYFSFSVPKSVVCFLTAVSHQLIVSRLLLRIYLSIKVTNYNYIIIETS